MFHTKLIKNLRQEKINKMVKIIILIVIILLAFIVRGHSYFCFQVFERFGKELCIVVTNLNQMSVEYFHPKTTPHTAIRRAVRMSVALPGQSHNM